MFDEHAKIVEKKGEKRYYSLSYKPDGTKDYVMSFYDPKDGEAAKIKCLSRATEKIAKKNARFRATLQKL